MTITSVSWSAANDLDLTDWVKQGHRFGMMGRSVGWWIGDWLRFGNAKYGEKYTRAKKITGYDTQTLMNMVWVSSRIDASRRRENLSWSHHMEVVAEDVPIQERLLDSAANEGLSVRDLRELIRLERSGETGRGPNQTSQGECVVCPQCGYSFDGHEMANGTPLKRGPGAPRSDGQPLTTLGHGEPLK